MKKIILTIGFLALALGFSNSEASAQRKSVSGAEVTGTFRSQFTGKFKGNYNEIKIQSLGKGKLKVAFMLTYPYMVNGGMSANTGTGGGEATIEGDTAVFTSEEYGQCKITLHFVKAGKLVVTQEGADGNCGFGHNVTADGTFTKFSAKKPKFDEGL